MINSETMIEKYFEVSHNHILSFDVVQFVKDHRSHCNAYNNLSSELDDIEKTSQFPTTSFEQERVQNSNTSDPTGRMAIIATDLRRRISEYEMLINLYDNTMSMLTEDERFILENMYGNPVYKPVQHIMDHLHIERATVYRYKNKAVQHFGHLVTGIYQTY